MYAEPSTLRGKLHPCSETELIHRWIQRRPPDKQRLSQQAIEQFRHFIAKPLVKVTSADISAFATYLSQQQLSPFSYREQLLVVKSFLRFANRQGAIALQVVPSSRSQVKLMLAKLLSLRLSFQWQLGLCASFFFGFGLMAPRWLGVVRSGSTSGNQNSLEWEEVKEQPSLNQALSVTSELNNPKVRAFLDTIAVAEGTAGPEGYYTQFTGPQFSSFEDHPRQIQCGVGATQRLCSDAAGRYQLLSPTWDRLAKKIGVRDFRPTNQDRVAVELIRERGALEDMEAGRFETAVGKLVRVWPSLKRLGGGSLEKSMPQLRSIYQQNLFRYRSMVLR